MARFHRLHVLSLVVQIIAFLLSFAVGVTFLVKANFLSATQDVVSSIRTDEELGSMSDLKVEDEEREDSLSTVWLVMTIVGGVALAASIIILLNIVCLLVLMCGPNSSFVQYCPFMGSLRDNLADEIASREEWRRAVKQGGHGAYRQAGASRGERPPLSSSKLRGWRRVSSESLEARLREARRRADKRQGYLRHIRARRNRRRRLSRSSSTPSASPEKDRKKYDKRIDRFGSSNLSERNFRKTKHGRGWRKTSSSPSASPEKDRKRYKDSLKMMSISPLSPPRFTSSSPSASPEKDRKKYEKKIKHFGSNLSDRHFRPTRHGQNWRTTSSSPSASPDRDKKKYRKGLRAMEVKPASSTASGRRGRRPALRQRPACPSPKKKKSEYRKKMEGILGSASSSESSRRRPKIPGNKVGGTDIILLGSSSYSSRSFA